jgi:hypothetical protein
METQKDLFENYEDQPQELAEIVNKWTEIMESDGYNYPNCDAFKIEVEKIGYTFDFGLDAEPYNLRISDCYGILASDFDENDIKK